MLARGRRELYPPIRPFHAAHLAVSDGHEIYYELSGNPEGKPTIFLHGGPGGGSSPIHRRFFNPDKYKIVLLDQRGCGQSRPHAEVENNTTAHLVEDIEALRRELAIEQWVLFGGSWGSTLALAYAIAHPERVSRLILRGIFLFRQQELDWFFNTGTPKIFPEAWKRFLEILPESARDDPIQGYRELLWSDPQAAKRAALAWTAWEFGAMSAQKQPAELPELRDARFALAFARIENHYFRNAGFFGKPNYILENCVGIAKIPTAIVHGRLDAICPVSNAWELAEALPDADLRIVEGAGHSAFEPGIVHELVSLTDEYAT